MRFTSLLPAVVAALLGASSVVAMPSHMSSLELSLYKRACDRTACSSAMAKELFPCAAAIGRGATGVVDAFSISQCVVNAINAGINVPSGCKDCGAALSAAAKKLGITSCANAVVAAGGACIRGATAAAKTCTGVFCKLTGIGGPAANPAIPLLPVSNRPPAAPAAAPAPAPAPAAPKVKPPVPPKPANLRPGAVPAVPKVKPVVPPKPAALRPAPAAPKVKPPVAPKPAALRPAAPVVPKVKPVVPPKPAALKVKPVVPPKPAKLKVGKKIREVVEEIETRSIEFDEE